MISFSPQPRAALCARTTPASEASSVIASALLRPAAGRSPRVLAADREPTGRDARGAGSLSDRAAEVRDRQRNRSAIEARGVRAVARGVRVGARGVRAVARGVRVGARGVRVEARGVRAEARGVRVAAGDV